MLAITVGSCDRKRGSVVDRREEKSIRKEVCFWPVPLWVNKSGTKKRERTMEKKILGAVRTANPFQNVDYTRRFRSWIGLLPFVIRKIICAGQLRFFFPPPPILSLPRALPLEAVTRRFFNWKTSIKTR